MILLYRVVEEEWFFSNRFNWLPGDYPTVATFRIPVPVLFSIPTKSHYYLSPTIKDTF